MKRLLAVRIMGSWKGGWHSVRGNESVITTSFIGEGEMVWLRAQYADNTLISIPLSAGPTSIDAKGWVRYRIEKEVAEGCDPTPTSVEVTLSGQASSQNRDAVDT